MPARETNILRTPSDGSALRGPFPVAGPRPLRLRRKQLRLCCLGDLTLDIVVRPAEPVAVGTDVAARIAFRVGGSAANAAREFARLGGKSVWIGAAGGDRLSGRLIASLRSDGVVVHAARVRGASARLVVMIDAGGERSFLTDRGVADRLSARALKRSWLTTVDALHLPAYSLLTAPLADASLEAARQVHERGGLVSVDVSSHKPLLALGRAGALARLSGPAPDLLFANAGEVGALVGGSRSAARRLLDIAPVVVVKAGGDGSRVLTRDGVDFDVATRTLKAEDTTGAGDAFDAGFLFALLSSGFVAGNAVSARTLHRAALAGHRSGARLLAGPRPELVL